jgi:Tfp pilus assembly protein PilN
MTTQDEIIKIVKTEIDIMIASFIRRFWYVVIGMVIGSAAAWYGLYYQVQQIEAQQDTDMAYTKEQIADNQKQIDTLRTDYKSDIREIKDDLKYIRDKI